MQTKVFLKGTALTDSAGHPTMKRPAVTMNTKTELILTQLDTSGNTGTIASWEFTVNEKCNAPDSVKLRISQGITADSAGAVHIDLGNTVSQELVLAMGQLPSRRMFGELAGYTSGNSVPIRCMQFPLEIRNRVGGGNYTPGTVSGTLTEAQVRALVADQAFVQKQADWDQTDTAKADYIKNKPDVPESLADLTGDSTHRTVTDAEKSGWNGKMEAVSGGTAGQYLKKTANGQEWADVEAGVQSVNGKTGTVVLEPSDLGMYISVGACTGLGIIGRQISWIDPDNVTVFASTLGTWDQTDLVRKQGTEYPTDHTDGTVVATTSRTLGNKNYYRDHSFEDTTAETGVTYRYKLFSKTAAGTWNNLDANALSEAAGCSWSQVQQFVRAGTAPNFWPVGTIFYVQHGEYASDSNGLAFRVVGYDQVDPADESLTHSMCLDMVNLLFNAKFDSYESQYGLTFDTTAQAGKTYYNSSHTALVEGTDYEVGDPVPASSWYEKTVNTSYDKGNNYFPQSNILQWANSSGIKNTWFVKQNPWDSCDSLLINKNGFLKHLESEFLAVVKPAKLITARAAVYGSGSVTTTGAKFWPLSRTQIDGSTNNSITENTRLQYYKDGGSRSKKYIVSGGGGPWMIRSPWVDYGWALYYFNASGTLQTHQPNGVINQAVDGNGVSLACIIA